MGEIWGDMEQIWGRYRGAYEVERQVRREVEPQVDRALDVLVGQQQHLVRVRVRVWVRVRGRGRPTRHSTPLLSALPRKRPPSPG